MASVTQARTERQEHHDPLLDLIRATAGRAEILGRDTRMQRPTHGARWVTSPATSASRPADRARTAGLACPAAAVVALAAGALLFGRRDLEVSLGL